ncbi:MAG: hypothetical protein COB12_00450 [Flavobacterium sp.]|nr:MAG: hypothetical protein COB12_00450 [Flavobacterium sp.]
MKKSNLNLTARLLLATLFMGSSFYSTAQNNTFQSANVLEFGSDNILFVGDSKSGKIYAFETETVENKTMQYGYNLKDAGKKIAAFLGTSTTNILVKDLAVHPTTKEAYIAISRISGEIYIPAIVIMNQSGAIRLFDAKKSKSTTIALANSPIKDFKFWDKVPSRSLTITDIDFHKGKLYVSGLSNADFASTLRVIDFPFQGSKQSNISIEMYHTNHGQSQTRAPIRTLEIVTLDNKEYLLAAFTCTPLVTIPLEDLKDGAHVTGKTIAELGFGNTPIDLIGFMAQDMEQNKYPVIYLSNKNQAAQVISLNQLTEGNKKEGLTTFTGFKKAGVEAFDVPVTSTLQVADQDGYHLLTIRRDLVSGNIELVSVMKNLYYRLSDFESEFEFPDYNYPEGLDFIKGVQNMQKKDEGFSDKVIK